VENCANDPAELTQNYSIVRSSTLELSFSFEQEMVSNQEGIFHESSLLIERIPSGVSVIP
jgi:hypothetical protein